VPPALLLLFGLVAVLAGAEFVIRCGSRLARRMGIPPIVVGLTVVSLGTSAPELAVGIDAIRSGAGSLAVGNIAGTNIVNLLLILGLSAVIRPIALGMQILKLDLPAMALASVLLLVLALDGTLSVFDGALLFALAIAYSALLIWIVRRENARVLAEFAEEFPEEPRRKGPWSVLIQLFGLLAGIAVIVLGADWLVRGAVDIALAAGVSEAFIGLTIVAIGTSAPELATTIVSTIRGERDIAIGNLIGSSTYNLTIILGISLFFAPGHITLDPELVTIDLPVMVLVSLVCIPVFLSGRRVSRGEGIAFVTGYAVFLAYLLIARM
jgi:cation:H+ antiporter